MGELARSSGRIRECAARMDDGVFEYYLNDTDLALDLELDIRVIRWRSHDVYFPGSFALFFEAVEQISDYNVAKILLLPLCFR